MNPLIRAGGRGGPGNRASKGTRPISSNSVGRGMAGMPSSAPSTPRSIYESSLKRPLRPVAGAPTQRPGNRPGNRPSAAGSGSGGAARQGSSVAQPRPAAGGKVVRGKTVVNGFSAPGTERRHRKVIRDSIQGVTKPDIRRLARRGGVKRISANIYPTVRIALKIRLQTILREAIIRCEYAGRNTVSVHDVLYALQRQGTPIYGFDPESFAPQSASAQARRAAEEEDEDD
ncbi:uncharacterized protein BROUX77_005213 [Berkeleyomyces rouxiae]|uniref:uncharacterized protein n=1 Tax=Berkeleyomyces rouxiae TaxID=2035830 RepID=UPI003B81150D